MDNNNWKVFLESYIPKSVDIEVAAKSHTHPFNESDTYFLIRSRVHDFEVRIDTDRKYQKLWDITFSIKNEPELGFTRHFEGMEYVEQDEKYLTQYLHPFLFEGWTKVDYVFLGYHYKTTLLDSKGVKGVGPGQMHSCLMAPVLFLLSLGDLMATKKITAVAPLSKKP